MYTKSDLKQFKRRGIKPEQIENQLENFKQGFDFVQIRDAATINNGIHGLNDEQANEFIRIFRLTYVQNTEHVFQHIHR